ncbi:SprT family zinc-dependent metalloprotease [Saccharospirillum sp. HFRX-1]|uniref:M48 family metallopeptidase n=1 Tax=unclassified Saccharospirillum TaxID=2633430 RepID=UPI00371D44CB
MTEVLSWRGEQIPIRRSKRKTLALHVRDGQVELRLPNRTRSAEVLAFVDSRAEWINKVREHQRQRSDERPDFSQAAFCPLMDQQLQLLLRPGRKAQWQQLGDSLQLDVADLDKDSVHSLLADFYKAQARHILTQKTEQLLAARGWSDRLLDIRLRRTRTKWGHCTAEGRIQYNWLIMLAPERVVDYLVAHETAHLLHPHHGPAFWAEVNRSHPSWKSERRWLHENGHRLQL